MRLRLPYLKTAGHPSVDEGLMREARVELTLAETALEIARAQYLRLQEQHQAAKLRLQQGVLDEALHRYHAARHAMRLLDRHSGVPAAWPGTATRHFAGGARLTKG